MFTHYSLDTLLGHSLTAIGRAADLVWWIFDVDGAEYSLHTQCTFRVLHDGEAVLSRSDIYCIRDDKPGTTAGSTTTSPSLRLSCPRRSSASSVPK